MASKIQIKRGMKASMPALSPGEFGLATDTKELFIGTANGNLQLAVLDDNGELPSGQVDLSGYVPTSRTVNGHALTGNVTLDAGDVGASVVYYFTATFLATGWTQSGGTGPYTQTVTCSGVLDSDESPLVLLQRLADADANALAEEAEAMVDYYYAGNGTLMARCPDGAPEVNFTVIVEVSR